MTEKNRPYTGIAGFTTAEEVRSVAADAPTIACYDTPHFGRRRLAIGVLVSWETLNGEAPRRYPERYPAVGKVRGILDAAAEPYHHRAEWQGEHEGTTFDLKARCLRLIHYSSKEPNLLAQLDRLSDLAGPNLDGFQFNMAWPDQDDLKAWAAEHPDMRLILQVNAKMFSNVARKPQLLVGEIAKRYLPRGIADILFDMSGGAGQKIDLAETEAAVDALHSAFGGQLGIGLAGGLDWQSVVDLKRFFEKWPDLSIDAEARVRDRVYDEKRDPAQGWKVVSKTLVGEVLGESAREFARRPFGVMPLRKTPEI